MLDKFNAELNIYFASWQQLIDNRTNLSFFEGLKPTALGWKVTDKAAYDQLLAQLHDDCDRIVETWMNDRWIAKLHLKDKTLSNGIEIIKIMQRRPNSDDALDLDHVDFYSSEVNDAEPLLKQEVDLNWTWESNDVVAGYEWISLWFAGTEAKLKSDTILDIIVAELQEINKHIKA